MGEEADALEANYDGPYDFFDNRYNYRRTVKKTVVKQSENPKGQSRGKKETYRCKRCGCSFQARVADRKRGWAKFCSKSCKAIHQEYF